MTLGLKRGSVRLCGHETEWEAEADRVIGLLQKILGEAAADIQHVGSTAIKTIGAKPIVDIAVAATDFEAVLAKEKALRAAGFYYRPGSMEGQLLFAGGSFYNGTGEEQTHFIHVVPAGGKAWRDYLNFRDYMNAFPAAAKAYEALKERLVREKPVDPGRAHYLAGKHAFIVAALRKASVWALLGASLHIAVDRSIGYAHQKGQYTVIYPVNYGYIPGVFGGDGEEQDVYLLGINEPVKEADCRVIGVVHRKNDDEDKLIAAPEGMLFSGPEMEEAVRFQEQYFDTDVIALSDKPDFDARYEGRA